MSPSAVVTGPERREEQWPLLAALGDDFGRASWEPEVMQGVGRRVGTYFHADNVLFAENDEEKDTSRVTSGWGDGVKVGRPLARHARRTRRADPGVAAPFCRK